jgi:hypothetical protein
MTLIVTVISDLGIIQASDSNITTAAGKLLKPGAKVFGIPFAHGALSFSGRYAVGGRPIDLWMPECIRDYGATVAPTLEGFANHLRDRLDNKVTADERRDGALIHIAGYADDADGTRHPEMWFVRNLGMEPTGEYSRNGGPFVVTEDFWARDYRDWVAAKPAGADSIQQHYFNGYSDGRIAYHALMQTLWQFYQQVWARPGWEFRRPRTLSELASFVRLEMHSVVTIFGSSDYPVPVIGGRVQLRRIKPPARAVVLS